ncbi:putative gustatory receptor 59d [Drosophila rhopaloa]|uniref:Gustatory receptor n=1 Tax=Drosophila rhopaloa TaxID=1041015 RepID=A0A6P4E9Y6_DRORH|nr:putative gustatory receptor 59d [Drosophila rhopaloa]
MVDLVKWCLVISYYYGRFTGVLNFEIDFKTGRARVTKRATICSALAHMIMCLLLGVQMTNVRVMAKLWSQANSLHNNMFWVMSCVRMTGVFLSLVNRWSQRRTFISLYNSIYSLYQHDPKIIQYCRRSIVSKCFCATVYETLQIIIVLIVTSNQLTISLAFGIWSILSLTSIINVIITQYFTAMALIRGRYRLLNKELRSILAETQSLIPNKSGVFVTKCCYLADELENISKAQSSLQALIERLSKAYQLQIICMFITYYLNFVANIYLLFSISKYSSIMENWPIVVKVGGLVFLVFYYLDCWLNSYNVLYLIDAHGDMIKLLSQRTLFQPGLDERLETVFETFNLNLARNPFKIRFFGLFDINRSTSFALGNSILTHSIVLIQYDVQNF